MTESRLFVIRLTVIVGVTTVTVSCIAPSDPPSAPLACLQLGYDGQPLRCLERPSAGVCGAETKTIDGCPKVQPVAVCDEPAGRLLIYQARDFVPGECEEAGGRIE